MCTHLKDVHVACNPQVAYKSNAYDACKGSHALCVLTEWEEFKALDFAKIYDGMVKPAFVFDGRNILDHVRRLHPHPGTRDLPLLWSATGSCNTPPCFRCRSDGMMYLIN